MWYKDINPFLEQDIEDSQTFTYPYITVFYTFKNNGTVYAVLIWNISEIAIWLKFLLLFSLLFETLLNEISISNVTS